jgi:phosphoribosylaminoimidazole-succinocarboxamide synthase
MIGSNDIEEAKLFHQGKVRDVFYYGKDFLIFATRQTSAFDYVLGLLF